MPDLHRPLRQASVLLLLALGSGCGGDEVPEGFARGAGRLEADEIQIATKHPGRVAEVRVDEGDRVEAGQVLARMDTGTLEAELARARAGVAEARQRRSAAAAVVAQRQSECALAEKDLDRAVRLHDEAVVSEKTVDEERTRVETAEAACDAARAKLEDAEAAIDSARASERVVAEDLDDATLVAPRAGVIQYRLAEPGEVLAAGGRVLTLLDLSEVTLTVFLPTAEAGRVRVGAEARVVLDARPELPIPARVSFVAQEAQFTPKQVETEHERQKLAFRVEVRVTDPRGAALNPGTPAVAWIRLDDTASWPEALSLPSPGAAP
jgi:HlyD family secretion protein